MDPCVFEFIAKMAHETEVQPFWFFAVHREDARGCCSPHVGDKLHMAHAYPLS